MQKFYFVICFIFIVFYSNSDTVFSCWFHFTICAFRLSYLPFLCKTTDSERWKIANKAYNE